MGITAVLSAGIDGIFGAGTAAGLADAVGLTAADAGLTSALGATGAGIVEGGLGGAALGAATSAITGGNPLQGAELGGITGGITGGIGGAFSSPTTAAAAPGVTGGTSAISSAPVAGGATLGSTAASAGAPVSSIAPGVGAGGGLGDLTAGAAPTGGAIGGAGLGADNVLTSVGTGTGSSLPLAASGGTTPGLTGALQGSETNAAAADVVGNATPTASSGAGSILKTLGLDNVGTDAKLAAGLGTAAYDLTRPGIKAIPGYSELASQAGALGTQGTQLESYITSGQLPAGAQASLDQGTQAAIAQIKSKFAAMGQSGSSQEASEIAAVQQNKAVEQTQIATGLLNSGIQESSLSTQIYDNLLKTNSAANNDLVQSLSGLVGALAGGGSTIKLATG